MAIRRPSAGIMTKFVKTCAVVLLVGIFLNVAPAKAYAPKPEVSEPKSISAVVRCLIDLESGGRNLVILDVNGKYSYGILMYQLETWTNFSRLSGIKGEPMNKYHAVQMAEWAVKNGYGFHWSTWGKCK